MMDTTTLSNPESTHGFNATRWEVVQRAACGDAKAFSLLAETYMAPIARLFARLCSIDQADSEEMARSFLQEALNEGLLAQADPNRGRFRTLLARAAGWWWTDRHQFLDVEAELPWSEAARTKDFPRTIPSDYWKHFDHDWSLAVFRAASARLFNMVRLEGHAERYREIQIALSRQVDHSILTKWAIKWDVPPAEVRSYLDIKRQEFGMILRRQIAHTVSNPADIEDEYRHLIRCLRIPH